MRATRTDKGLRRLPFSCWGVVTSSDIRQRRNRTEKCATSILYLQSMKEHLYFVYILLCSDDTYYTGVTNDINRREKEHLEGYKESSYTHYRQPTLLVYQEEFRYIDKAIAREKQLKKWSQAKKRALINDYADRLPLFSKKKFE
jgi:putative endonuclease